MKEELVKRALDAGILLTPEMLDSLDDQKLERMILESKQKKTVLADKEPTSRSKLLIKMGRVIPKQEMMTEDFTKYYNNKYDGIKNILLKKMDAVSINKVRDTYDEVSLIGMVREVTPNGFILEDQTGEIEILSPDPVDVDDVVGVKGSSREGKLLANEIVWPDISLSNQLKKISNISLLLTTKVTPKSRSMIHSSSFTLIPDLEDADLNEKETGRVMTKFTNPTTITISSTGNEMNILVYTPEEDVGQEKAKEFLKKRHLSPGRNKITGPDDHFLINTVPDILWLVSPKRFLENYKGVTIISCKAPDAAIANLGTREVEFKQI